MQQDINMKVSDLEGLGKGSTCLEVIRLPMSVLTLIVFSVSHTTTKQCKYVWTSASHCVINRKEP